MLKKKKMKNLPSYNLITILNCGKVKALNGSHFHSNHIYDVCFNDLDKMEMEHIIKMIGLYPLPFFSLKTDRRATITKETSVISSLWRSIYFSNKIYNTNHALTLTSLISDPHELYDKLSLSADHWVLLNRHNVKDVRQVFTRIGRSPDNGCNPSGIENNLRIPFDRIIQTNLPHDIVSALTGLPLIKVKQIRAALIHNGFFLRKKKVQKQALDRHSFDRFSLFIAVCYFKLLSVLNYQPIEAYLRTIEILEHAPTIKANMSSECHLSVNLYYWLRAHHLLPTLFQDEQEEITPEIFPESVHSYFDHQNAQRIPNIKNMGIFPIPHGLDIEHKRFLTAINEAITYRQSLDKVLCRYYSGSFA